MRLKFFIGPMRMRDEARGVGSVSWRHMRKCNISKVNFTNSSNYLSICRKYEREQTRVSLWHAAITAIIPAVASCRPSWQP